MPKKKVGNMAGWSAIQAEAERLGWPICYARDLECDRNTLAAADAPKEFGWAVREAGTNLYIPGFWPSVMWAEAATHRSDERYYWYNGHELAEVTGEELRRRLRPPLWQMECRYRICPRSSEYRWVTEGLFHLVGIDTHQSIVHVQKCNGASAWKRRFEDIKLTPVWDNSKCSCAIL